MTCHILCGVAVVLVIGLFWVVILFMIAFFILGSAVGSFLNVVADRAAKGGSILGRSHCDYCAHTLSAIDLVPIASFIGLWGRCRRCGKRISWQYPAIELLSGFLFIATFYTLVQAGNFGIISLLYYLILASVFLVVGIVDFKFSLIPTSFVYFASLLALFYDYFSFLPSVFITHVIWGFAAAFFFLVIVIVTRGRGMGEGDIPLAFLLGLVLGFPETLLAVFLAFLAGAFVSVALILFGKKHFGQTVPFAPFLIFGIFASLYFGQTIIGWYLMLY